ncbi:MAG: hypothetical protein EOO77_36990 [Oxalobacteraceae bacterium]|nr:MAG: hypothetical protein EOO77_36990 [Oxalobacteraceae bacterium]
MLRDADHVYIADFAQWLGEQIDRGVLEQNRTGVLRAQDRPSSRTRVRSCMTAWSADPEEFCGIDAHAVYQPHMAYLSVLKQMACAQEGFDLLRNYLDTTPDDVIAWATLAETCLNQQVLQDSTASLMCEDDAAPSAKALMTGRFALDPDMVDAIVRFGASGLALFDEGQAALLQALSRAQHEPPQVRRLVASTLDAYADAMGEAEVTHRDFVDQETNVQSVAQRFNTHFAMWAPHYHVVDDELAKHDLS